MRVAFFCICLLSASTLSAQEDRWILPIQELEQPRAVFIEAVDASLTRDLIGLNSSITLRHGTGTRVLFSSFSPSNQNLLDYLNSSNVQQQIELSAEQKQQLNELRKDFASSLQKISSRYPGRNNPQLPAEMKAKVSENYSVEIKALRKRFEEQAQESLVPQQLKLIKQLKFNTSVRLLGFSQTLSQKPFQAETKVTEKQSRELQKIKQETEAAIQKKVAEMRAAAKGKMLKVLDAEQRKAIKELEGKSKLHRNSDTFPSANSRC